MKKMCDRIFNCKCNQLVACNHKSFGYVLIFSTSDNVSTNEKVFFFLEHQAIHVHIYFLMH